ncbi:hypothetical protein C8Q73DRAFT_182631 [Cubamyces lactineus]|nr:hypothetical protein C8Q73DRAFT_182631 [Cubamyces lactineus]
MPAPSSSSSSNLHGDVIFPHPAHRAFILNGQAMHVDIPRTNARASASHITPGHGHTNVRLPTPLDTPAHGHALFAVPSPLDTPGHGHTNVSLFAASASSTPVTPGHGHTNVSLFSLASPHPDSPSTPTQPRPVGRASRRRNLFSSAADSDANAGLSVAGTLASLPEESDGHSGAEHHENDDGEGDFDSSMSEDDSDRA